MMEVNTITLAAKLAGIFSCATFLTLGTIVLLKTMSLDFDSVIYACKICITGAIITGIFGFAIGKLFETSELKNDEAQKLKKDPDLLIDDLLINDLDSLDNDNDIK